jgi:hypothetical protein
MPDDKPTELELKLLMLLLMRGGEVPEDEWWSLRRSVDADDTVTQLKYKQFLEITELGFRISAKGRRAVEEASCQKTG